MKVQVKLSPTQIKAVEKMERDIWYSSYDLQIGLNTLNALHDKGVVKKRGGLGSIWSPQTNIHYKLI